MVTTDAVKLAAWKKDRARLVGLAYRMLGEVARAEDLVQEAWLRFSDSEDEVREPSAYLVTVVTRLCVNELQSARARKERPAELVLPEPVDTRRPPFEDAESVSTAFMVMLQRLSAPERAVLLLHEVFEYDHAEIAQILGKSAAACRKLLERARANVAEERRMLEATREEHSRLLQAFVAAVSQDDVSRMVALLAEDATLIADRGPGGVRIGGVLELDAPVQGARRVAAFLCAIARKTRGELEFEVGEVSGRAGLVFRRGGEPFAVMTLGVVGGKVGRVYFRRVWKG